MKGLLVRVLREEDGQDLIEYALLAAFIALAAIVVLGQIGPRIAGVFTNINDQLPQGGGGGGN